MGGTIMEKDITKKIKPFIIYSVPIILLIAVVAIFGVYKWNQGQGIININDAKLTSSKVMVVAQNDGTLTELLVNDGDKVEAGQVIAKMKVVVTPEQIEALQKAYDEAKVNYDNLEQQVKASMVVSQPVVTSSSTGNVVAAQARLDAAAANKQKMDKLYSIGAVSATQYAEAQSEYAAAQSALAAASTPQVVEQQASVSSAPSKELSLIHIFSQ